MDSARLDGVAALPHVEVGRNTTNVKNDGLFLGDLGPACSRSISMSVIPLVFALLNKQNILKRPVADVLIRRVYTI